ncbi:hypothetical protein [Desulfonatronum thioautotrophicum]|uniref:hypothetical protein n=1 Tax=Desulfonatronum thioautotrophicum TaxID=617001 RepID=UPI0005EB9A07|nr:hypothetical protein [Desulfonatronum thioautotrophicum]
MSKDELSKEEQTLLDAVESGEFESVFTQDRGKDLAAIADNTFRKDGMVQNWLKNPRTEAGCPTVGAHLRVRP